MNARTRLFLCTLLLCACGGTDTSTVVIALGTLPPTVATLGITVRDVESGEEVTSATVAAPRTEFVLGVPAEQLLEFTVVARTNRPGSPGLGAMPAYVGRTTRAVALGREQERIAITVQRAGVLTVLGVRDVDVEAIRGYRLEPALGAEAEVVLTDGLTDGVAPRTLILRTGRYDALPIEEESDDPDLLPDFTIANGRGLWVEAERESVARLTFSRTTPPLAPGRANRLAIAVAGSTSPFPTVRTGTSGTARIDLAVRALDGVGQSSSEVLSNIRVDLIATPATVVIGATRYLAARLPLSIDRLGLAGMGRLVVRAHAVGDDGREVTGELALNVAPVGVLIGGPEEMRLQLEAPETLDRGGTLLIDLYDRRGLFAEARASVIDLSESDPWAFFPGGPLIDLGFSERGHIRREIARPSGPRDLPVIVRATLTSTLASRVITSSVTLPLLEISPR